jgi:hypothetical protein
MPKMISPLEAVMRELEVGTLSVLIASPLAEVLLV